MEPITIDTGLHLVVAGCGFGGVILAQWRGSITTRNRIDTVKTSVDRLAAHVEKQNGTLDDQKRKMHEQALVCAETHGRRGARGIQVEPG